MAEAIRLIVPIPFIILVLVTAFFTLSESARDRRLPRGRLHVRYCRPPPPPLLRPTRRPVIAPGATSSPGGFGISNRQERGRAVDFAPQGVAARPLSEKSIFGRRSCASGRVQL